MAQSKKEHTKWRCTARYLSNMTHMTLEMEYARENSLRSLAGILLTGASIVSVALLAAAPSLFQFFDFDPYWEKLLLLVYCFALSALLLAVLFAVLSQMRFGYQALPTPEEIRRNIDNGEPFDEIEVARHENKTLQPVYESCLKKNETVRHLLKASMISAIVALCVVAIGGVALCACAFNVL